MPDSMPHAVPPTVRIHLLGGFRVVRDDQPVPDSAWQRRSGRTLIKLLAVTPDHRLHREQIEEALWPDLPATSAASQFRKAVHFARHALDPGLGPRQSSARLRIIDDLTVLDPATVWVDADAFQHAASAAIATDAIDALEQAHHHYTGELLPEDRFEDWATARREALTELHRSLMLALARQYEHRGTPEMTATLLQELLREDSAREDVHQWLMRLAASHGSRHQALRQYQACRAALREDLGVDPSAETEALYQHILNGQFDAAPAAPVPLPGAIRRQPESALIGRQPVLELLRADGATARRGNGRAILVSGEMGVGKNRLMTEFARIEHRNGAVVLWGTAYEQERQSPYAPFVDALDGYIARLPETERNRLGAASGELCSLIPSLGRPSGTTPDLGQDGQPRFFATIARFLSELSPSRPLLLVLDDLHLADASSLELFHYLVHAASDRCWLIAGMFRDDMGVSRPMRQLANDVERHHLGRQVTLSRLSRPDCNAILAGMVEQGDISEGLLDEIHARTLGNALFVREYMQDLIDRRMIAQRGNAWELLNPGTIEAPSQVRYLIEARIERLGNTVPGLLSLAATAGNDCSLETLRAASGLDDGDLLDMLDVAISAHIMTERGNGYGFVHPVYREVLYERLSKARRINLHAALAMAIEQQLAMGGNDRPALVAALAHHWVEAQRPECAIPRLIEAASHAAQVYARAEAFDRLQQARALTGHARVPEHQVLAWRAAIHEQRGDLYALAGEARRAWDEFERALATNVLSVPGTIRVHRQAARQALALADFAGAEPHIAAATALAARHAGDDGIDGELVRLKVVTAQAHFLANRFTEALAVAEEGAALARSHGSDANLAEALEMVSMACLPLGEWQRGIECERQHAGIVDVNRFVRDMTDVHFCFGEYHLYAAEPAATAQTFVRTLAESERAGAPRSLALCHYYLGVTGYFRGQFRDAIRHQTSAIELFRQVESPFGQAVGHLVRGVSETALGRLDVGQADLEAGLGLAHQGILGSHATIRLYAGLCRNRLDANDAPGALIHADRGLALTGEPSTCICYASFLPGATAAYAVNGDLDQAAMLGARALKVATAFQSPAFRCMAQQANAMVFAMRGDWPEAFVALDDAQDLAQAHDFPYELSRSMLLRSFVHLQRRSAADVAAASRLMLQASSMLVRLGVRTSSAQLRSSLGFLRQHASQHPALPG